MKTLRPSVSLLAARMPVVALCALDARTLSTVATHAGEMLYGRSYKIEMLDKHGDRL